MDEARRVTMENFESRMIDSGRAGPDLGPRRPGPTRGYKSLGNLKYWQYSRMCQNSVYLCPTHDIQNYHQLLESRAS